MKNLIYIFLLGLLCPNITFSQCVGEINTPFSSEPDPNTMDDIIRSIDYWDWREETFELHIYNSVLNTTTTSIKDSPFFLNGFIDQPNTNHLGGSTFKDNAPEDGWELVLKNFGTPNQGITMPFFILYNRYSGKLRSFSFLSSPDQIDEVETTLAFYTIAGIITHVNASLENSFLPMDAIAGYSDKSLMIENLNIFQDNGGIWLFADIPTTYDPCTCKYSSGLIFKNRSINTENVTLTIEGGGTIEEIITGGTVSSSALSLKNFNINNLQAGIKKGTTAYKSVGKLVTDIDKQLVKWFKTKASPQLENEAMNSLGLSEINSGNIQQVMNFLENSEGIEAFDIITKAKKAGPASILPKWLKDIVPYAGAIAGFVDFFIARPSPAPQPMRFEAKLNFVANGEITDIQNLQSNSFLMPGAKQENINPNLFPIYQNNLGVINLIQQPDALFDTWKSPSGGFLTGNQNIYKLNRPIKYAINPASGMVLKDIRGAVFFQSNTFSGTSAGAIIGSNQLIKVEEGLWRTPWMPLGCLEEYAFKITTKYYDEECYPNRICPGTLYLNVIADFNKGTISQSYKINIRPASISGIVSNEFISDANLAWDDALFGAFNPLIDIPEITTVADLNAYIANPVFAWNEIIIPGGTIVTEDNKDLINDLLSETTYTTIIDAQTGIPTIIQTSGKQYSVGSVISEETSITNVPNCRAVHPVSPQELEDLCSNPNTYNPKAESFTEENEQATIREDSEDNNIKNNIELSLFPNPTSSRVIVKFELKIEETINLTLYDLLGSTIKTFGSQKNIASGSHRIEIDLNDVPSGSYFLELKTPSKTYTEKLVKQ
jgi:hypothetical protein